MGFWKRIAKQISEGGKIEIGPLTTNHPSESIKKHPFKWSPPSLSPFERGINIKSTEKITEKEIILEQENE